MSDLFSPFALGPLQLKNRIVIAPMCQYSAHEGQTTDWHLIHLGQLALSGAGLLLIEATAVSPEGRISPADLGLWNEATEAALHRTLAAVRACSSMPIGVQLAHAGRKASVHKPWLGGGQVPASEGGWLNVAPSALAFNAHDLPPEALDDAGLARVQQAFVDAALRAVRLGLDVIELHAAHGYLLHQFLSPLSNQRTDACGGSLENRLRFPLAVFDAVKAAVPAGYPVGVRLSATDWVDGGWDVEQSVALCQALDARGVAYLHVSSGGLDARQQIPLSEGYQLPFAKRIKAEVKAPVIGVGLITRPAHAEQIVSKGDVDLVGLARAMLYDPHWPWHAAAELGAQVEAPPQYLRSQPREFKNLLTELKPAKASRPIGS